MGPEEKCKKRSIHILTVDECGLRRNDRLNNAYNTVCWIFFRLHDQKS